MSSKKKDLVIWRGKFLDGYLEVNHAPEDEGHLFFRVESDDKMWVTGDLKVTAGTCLNSILLHIRDLYLIKIQDLRDVLNYTVH